MPSCLNCNRTEKEYPLITLAFQGEKLYVCPQCLPILIHKPYQLADKIANFTPPTDADLPSHEH